MELVLNRGPFDGRADEFCRPGLVYIDGEEEIDLLRRSRQVFLPDTNVRKM